MGDGQSYSYGLQLCIDSFNKDEIERFISVLINRYELDASLRKMTKEGQYRIYISAKSMNKLYNLTNPYIVESMFYKIIIKTSPPHHYGVVERGGTNSKFQIPNSKFQIPNSKFQIPNSIEKQTYSPTDPTYG